MILIDKVTKRYGDKVAVKNVSLKIEKGRIHSLLGPNGAGKTTLIKMITTVMKPNKGRIIVENSENDEEIRRKIGVVFQENSLDEMLTVRETLWVHSKLYNTDFKKCDEILKKFGLEKHANKLIKQLSGGLKRRVEIARALMHDPEILIMDEPTQGLDPASKLKVWECVKKQKQEGRTIIITTHNMEEAEKLSDEITIINNGKIIITGTPQQLINSLGEDAVIVELENNTNKIKLDNSVKYDDHLMITTNNAEKKITTIIKEIEKQGGKIKSISIKKPSLNEVFIKYAGEPMK